MALNSNAERYFFDMFIRTAFTLQIFLSSFLLFMVQPMVGKILLPALGGVPAVWTLCMLFFQLILLCGYLYAHKSVKHLRLLPWQSALHLVLIGSAIFFLPLDINLSGAAEAVSAPESWLLRRLFGSIGLLVFVISANSPLIQNYYAHAAQNDSHDPYFLYSAGNAGSLLALLFYPFLLEPGFSLSQQRLFWSYGFVALALLTVVCIAITARQRKKDAAEQAVKQAVETKDVSEVKITLKQKMCWVLAGALPCSAMLGVTTYIATDIASMPLLWIIPLSIYLLSFILAYAKTDYWRSIQWASYMFPAVLLCIIMYNFALTERIWLTMPIHLTMLFLLCMTFHCWLASERPPARDLGSYYVWMSLGGALGGLFNSVAAPLMFVSDSEYVITLIGAGLTVSYLYKASFNIEFSFLRKLVSMAVFLGLLGLLLYINKYMLADMVCEPLIVLWTVAAMFLIYFYRYPQFAWLPALVILFFAVMDQNKDSGTIYASRNFFGIIKVRTAIEEGETLTGDFRKVYVKKLYHRLQHGSTLHGLERICDTSDVPGSGDETDFIRPLAYYAKEGPVGAVMRAGTINRHDKKIGVVGLGAGSLAWYGRSWQSFDFYEIDPEIVRIAEDPRYFTFLNTTKASYKNIIGDARINLGRVPDHSYDLLIIDAYTSDTLPLHLMTLEAVSLYMSKIKPDGLLVMHVSNRHFYFAPVVKRICDELKLACVKCYDDNTGYSTRYDWYDCRHLTRSEWVAVSPETARFDILKIYADWEPISFKREVDLWTDDHTNLLQVFDFRI